MRLFSLILADAYATIRWPLSADAASRYAAMLSATPLSLAFAFSPISLIFSPLLMFFAAIIFAYAAAADAAIAADAADFDDAITLPLAADIFAFHFFAAFRAAIAFRYADAAAIASAGADYAFIATPPLRQRRHAAIDFRCR